MAAEERAAAQAMADAAALAAATAARATDTHADAVLTAEGRDVTMGAATSPDIELGMAAYDGDCVGEVTMVDLAGPGPAAYDVTWTGRADGRRVQGFDDAQ